MGKKKPKKLAEEISGKSPSDDETLRAVGATSDLGASVVPATPDSDSGSLLAKDPRIAGIVAQDSAVSLSVHSAASASSLLSFQIPTTEPFVIPSVEAAKLHGMKTAVTKLNADGTYSRYSILTSSRKAHVGVGISQFFYLVNASSHLMILLGLVTVVALVANILGNQSVSNAGWSHTVSLHHQSGEGSTADIVLYVFTMLSDLLAMMVFIVWLYYSTTVQARKTKKYRKKNNVRRYTIHVTNIPKHGVTPGSLRAFFSQWGPVAELGLVLNRGKLTKLNEEWHKKHQKLCRLRVVLHREFGDVQQSENSNIDVESSSTAQLDGGEGDSAKSDGMTEKKLKLYERFNGLVRELSHLEGSMLRILSRSAKKKRQENNGHCFITYESAEDRDRAFAALRGSLLDRIKYWVLFWKREQNRITFNYADMCPRSEYALNSTVMPPNAPISPEAEDTVEDIAAKKEAMSIRGKAIRLHARQPSDPSDIIWVNLCRGQGEYILRQVFTTHVIAFSIMCSFIILLIIKLAKRGADSNSVKNMFTFVNAVVTIANFLVMKIGVLWAVGFERHKSMSGREKAILDKLFITGFLNSGIITLVLSMDQPLVSITDDVIVLMTVNAILPNITGYLSPAGSLGKFIKMRTALTQAELNEAHSGLNVGLSEMYIYVLKTIALTLLFSTATPLIYWISAVGCAINYWMNKVLMFYRMRRPPMWDDRLVYHIRPFFFGFVVLHWFSSVWLYSVNVVHQRDNATAITALVCVIVFSLVGACVCCACIPFVAICWGASWLVGSGSHRKPLADTKGITYSEAKQSQYMESYVSMIPIFLRFVEEGAPSSSSDSGNQNGDGPSTNISGSMHRMESMLQNKGDKEVENAIYEYNRHMYSQDYQVVTKNTGLDAPTPSWIPSAEVSSSVEVLGMLHEQLVEPASARPSPMLDEEGGDMKEEEMANIA